LVYGGVGGIAGASANTWRTFPADEAHARQLRESKAHLGRNGVTPRVRNFVGICGFLATRQILASLGAIIPFLLPSPVRVGETAVDLLADGSLLRPVLASLERVFLRI
jgi:ABC-type nitrate/sulfonate/bicarbonate transport system permease component